MGMKKALVGANFFGERRVNALVEAEQWYSNKELFEMINGLKADLSETRRVVKEYNDLRRSLNDCIRRVAEIEQRGVGRQSVEQAILRWTPWVITIASAGAALYAFFGRWAG